MKGMHMTASKNAYATIWGIVIGAGLCATVGFTWGGWVTSDTARNDAAAAAHDATVVALAPLCAERFRAQDDALAKVADLAQKSIWERDHLMEKSGFAVMPGAARNDSDIAHACVEILLAPATPKT